MNSGLEVSMLSASASSSPLQMRQAAERAAGPTTPANGSQSDFSTVLANAASSFTDTVNKAEAASIAGIKGEADVYQVASTVMEAEQAIKMAVAVRDKIVAAYLEISRMQI